MSKRHLFFSARDCEECIQYGFTLTDIQSNTKYQQPDHVSPLLVQRLMINFHRHEIKKGLIIFMWHRYGSINVHDCDLNNCKLTVECLT